MFIAAQRFQCAFRLRRARRRAADTRARRVAAETERLEREAKVVEQAASMATDALKRRLDGNKGRREKREEARRIKRARAEERERLRALPKDAPERRHAALRETFDMFDLDGSGGIDRDELEQVTRELCAPMAPAALDAAMAAMDRDGSGVVDFDEFVAWYLSPDARGAGGGGAMLLKLRLKSQKVFRDLTGRTGALRVRRNLLAKTYAEASAKAQERFQEKYPVDKFYHEHVDTEAYNPTRRKRRLLTARENEVAKEKEMLKAAEKL